MKLHLASLLSLVGWHAKAHEPLDYLRLVNVVAQIEGASPNYISPTRARGIYQIKPATWAQYSKKPHAYASSNAQENHRVAVEHARWIVQKALPALGLPITPYSFALLWGNGFGNVQRLNLTDSNVDFGKRFENLYNQR